MKHAFFLLLGLVLIGNTLRANGSIYLPLVPPEAEEIVAFTNGLAPATGLRKDANREQVLCFLRRGKNNLNVESWPALEYPQRRRIDGCNGVMVDRRGNFFFWSLRSAKTLKLETSDGRTALLQLP